MRLLLWFLRLGCIFLFSVGLGLGCGQSSSTCQQCSPGAKRCSTDLKALQVCKKSASTKCWQWIQTRCNTGQVCGDDNGLIECRDQPTCSDVCQANTARCNGQELLLCQKDPATGCAQWSKQATCTPSQRCDQNSGTCQEIGGCQSTNPQAEKKCVGQSVHWFDNCGTQGAMLETCQAPKTCQNGACSDPGGCQSTNPQAEKKCVGQSVHWFDNCGTQGAMVETCQAPQTCQNGACAATNCQPKDPETIRKCVGNNVHWFDDCGNQGKLIEECTPPKKCLSGLCSSNCQPQSEKKCVLDTVYWFDSCGNQGAKIEQCAQGEQCQNGACSDPCLKAGGQNQCTLGATQCAGGGVQSCERNPQTTCLQWGTTTPCSSGQTCQNGTCTAGQSNQCSISTSDASCSSDSECCAGQSCKKYLEIIRGCSCNSDADCPKINGVTPTKCCNYIVTKLCATQCF